MTKQFRDMPACGRANVGAALRSALLLTIAMVPWSFAHASKSVDEKRSADPKGIVEIVDLAGSLEVSAWDRPEVEVSGTLDDNVERVDVKTSAERTSINVIFMSGDHGHGSDTRLTVHVPAASSLMATLLSANLKINGVRGDVTLRTVNGDVSGQVGGDLRANTVSGTVRVTAREAKQIEVRTISGDVTLSGGNGEAEITTVSGTVKVDMATLTRGRFKSVSGDVTAKLTLAPSAELESESVSGSIRFDFHANPNAEFDVRSFSGEIESCFGPAPEKPRYGPGSRLTFKNGDGHGTVRVDTKSGDVNLCAKG